MSRMACVKMGIGWCILVVLAFLDSSAIRSQQCAPNGCGPSGWMGTFVPNAVGNCKLKEACDKHDACYSRCTCGDLIDRPECEGKCLHPNQTVNSPVNKAILVRKHVCDDKLEKDIIEANGGGCKKVAAAYRFSVAKWGCPNFKGFGPDNEIANKHRFQKNFEEALRIIEFAEEHPGELDVEESRRNLETMAEIPRLGQDNDLSFETSGGKPRISLKAHGVSVIGAAPRSQIRAVNGIDVTEAQLNGEAFDLGEARTKFKVELPGLNQATLPLSP
jgi:hypothetical protein